VDSLVAAVAGLIGGLVLTPAARALAMRTGIVDEPGDLKTQRVPVAYLGGVAVFLAALPGPLLAGEPLILVPAGLALALGLADDLRPLPVSARVLVEVLVAVAAASVVPGPFLVRLATGVLVLGLLNAVNLLDGQDGLAAGVGAVIAIGFALLGGAASPVALGLAGALAGFLVFNRPPASIYLGDAGAYFIGTAVAMLPALTEHAGTSWSTWWAVPLLLGLPVADTAIAIVRRVRAHRPLLQGDRSHVYDQLVDRGASIGQSTLVGIGTQVLLTAIGLAATQAQPAIALSITLGTACALAIVATRAGLLDASRV
jgi:UDP-GlcNAc:undecaprenyl-phosphate GlcNAc-1-phosphate transferase